MQEVGQHPLRIEGWGARRLAGLWQGGGAKDVTARGVKQPSMPLDM
jgi:hypothetical protein